MTELSGERSQNLFHKAQEWIPGGVNSPVRAWKRLGGKPAFIAKGQGSQIIDVDGKTYIDYVLSWGPLLHGHANPSVLAAIEQTMRNGLSFGAPCEQEHELAQLLCEALPGMDKVRLVNSGTEATMSALRVARAATGRDLIVKCNGCYHGHSDQLLVAAGSGAATFGNPDSAGVPKSFTSNTLCVDYNDEAGMAALFVEHGSDIAAIIIEPIAGNMGFVLPQDGYLAALRKLCDQHGALLIFDEVMTGFRTAWGGYQRVCNIEPDMTCLGKVIGGGMPLAAYGGKESVMSCLAPDGPCYQAGTLSGNPVAVAAGIANLKLASAENFYQEQEEKVRVLTNGLKALAAKNSIAMQTGVVGTMWGYVFADEPVKNFADAENADLAAWEKFCRGMLERGVYLAASPFEAAFYSSVHTEEDLARTLTAAEEVFDTWNTEVP